MAADVHLVDGPAGPECLLEEDLFELAARLDDQDGDARQAGLGYARTLHVDERHFALARAGWRFLQVHLVGRAETRRGGDLPCDLLLGRLPGGRRDRVEALALRPPRA